ncbi:MAG: phenylalanine--tRNA ligase subunit alpha [Anaerolineales bacterium]|nr:phenylalanine--tRNA ligase subunit alpha [Anaerolineales bacterium]
MLEQLETIEKDSLAALEAVKDSAALAAWKTAHLGRSAPLSTFLGDLGKLPAEQRPQAGKRGNEIKRALEAAYGRRGQALEAADLERALHSEQLDVTLPGRPVRRGRLHPSSQVLRRIYAVWADMGFQVYRSPNVESDEYNFTLLNIPPHHPARDMWDTFYTTDPGVLLRTHTSPGQIHAMREYAPGPVRVILPGMCYRYEQITARSEIQFHQVEGLAVGPGITFANLKGTLADFARRMWGETVRTQFRADHFPFTEPSLEMDIECFLCAGKGCPVCKYSGWLEILGAGMVHPTVLSNGGYDPKTVSGFAFGMGPERIAMLRHGIEDIRYFWGNDLRFLEQF